MNSKNNSATAQENITRKEWRRNKRRTIYLRKKEARLAIKTKNDVNEKRYDIMAQYHAVLNNSVREIISKEKIKYAILTDTYFVCTNLTKQECETLEAKFKDCKESRGQSKSPWTIKFAKWKSKTIIHNSKTQHTNTNNTEEVRSSARSTRKAKNIAKHPKFAKHANNEKKKSTKENPVPMHGRKDKIMAFRHGKNKFKSTAKVTPALKETSLEKKLRQRALKAGKYLIKQEKKASTTPIKVKKSKKPVQQKFKFAA